MTTPTPPPLPFNTLSLDSAPQIFDSEPNWHWSTTIPNYYNLWITLEGNGSMEIQGKVYDLHPGRSFLLPPGQQVSATHDSNHPIRNFAAHIILPPPLVPTPLLGILLQELTRARELCRAIVQTSRHLDALARQQTDGLCYQLLAQLWRDAHAPDFYEPDTRMLQIAERMVERPWDWQAIPHLAKTAGYSTAQFNRRFKVLIGQSPAQYAIHQRMRRARELLEQSNMQVGEIAETLGYRDIHYFSRQFKEETGSSPQTHRRSKAPTNNLE